MQDNPPYDSFCTQVHEVKSPTLHLGATDKIKGYIQESLAHNSQIALRRDLEHFKNWGGRIPATEDMIALYLSEHAETHSIATLRRRLSSISQLHKMAGYDSPIRGELVRMLMRGIQRTHGKPQRQASPLLRDDLISILNHIPNDARGVRNKALLMVGFAGALRRSELVGVNIEDIEFVSEGVIIILLESKTDQERKGRKIAIPQGRSRHCVVQALQDWLFALECKTGPLFRSIRKGGSIQDARLSDSAVSCIVKEYAEEIGLNPLNYSGHSLRSGFVTSAAQMGVPEWRIMRQSGHKSYQTMMRYVRDARLFENHPLDSMF